jgi:hypothetical protein
MHYDIGPTGVELADNGASDALCRARDQNRFTKHTRLPVCRWKAFSLWIQEKMGALLFL